MRQLLTLFTILLSLPIFTYGQEMTKAEFSEDHWIVEGKKFEFTEYKGKKALFLDDAKARWQGASFKQGIIEYDIAFVPGRKFLGVHFRSQDLKNYEEFYIRAHQSGNPDAMQYTPVYNGNSGWQLYHGKGYSNAYNYLFEEWNHVRLIISDDQMDVFINDMSIPVLHVHDLKREAEAGKIGFSTFLGSAYFANLSYQEIENPVLVSEQTPLPRAAKGTIDTWQVSSAFPENQVSNTNDLSTLDLNNLEWGTLKTEYSGTLNLSQLAQVSQNSNTVLVKVNIDSKVNQIKKLDIGYSDIARVFLNDQILYAGQNRFRSRDYRYLGTIGYFDTVYLDLKKGKNELVLAITENSGGWGIKAKIEDTDQLSFN